MRICLENKVYWRQIIILSYSIEHNLGLEKYVTRDIDDAHMGILIEFLEDGRSIDDYFFNDGTLDIPTLELDDESELDDYLVTTNHQ